MNNNLKIWVNAWQMATDDLASMRMMKIRQSNISQAIECFNSAFKSAILNYPTKPYSGLVEQQKYFQKLIK